MKESLVAVALILLAYLGLYAWGGLVANRARGEAVFRDPSIKTMEDHSMRSPGPPAPDHGTAATTSEVFLLVAFVTSLVATLGALFIGEFLGQMPCTLCWYQRIAMFPLVPILAIGLWRGDTGARDYALPLVLAGLAIALWHSGLYAGLIPETVSPCTKDGPSCSDRAQMTILGLPIPYLSLGAFLGIALCLGFMKGNQREP